MACHEGGDVRIPQPGKSVMDFRPGTPLDRTIAVFAIPPEPRSPGGSPLLKHYSLTVLSKCYLSSAGKLSCITCHDPHQQPAGADAVDYYREKCLGCHTQQSCSLSSGRADEKGAGE
jgi:Doubled CXXCH motif (Paired_CXXCH_1)